MKRVLSCIQPTGDLHLGNYFGAVQNWVQLQEQYECVFGVVDYHSMTMPYKPETLRENTWKMAFYLLACGVKPENLFIQSLVPEHAELAWVLGCVTSYGELQRMTQFKDKTDQLGEHDSAAFVSAGLFNYPVLQAADILIYKADYVPVGKDQVQHLELSRNIAQRFNKQFKKEVFKLPSPLLTEFPKIMSLADPNKKMSKSLGEKHYINVFGDEAKIREQIKKAVTEIGDNPEEMSPGVQNLFLLLKACGNQQAYDHLMNAHRSKDLKFSELKATVADAVIELCRPIRDNYKELISKQDEIKDLIRDSSFVIRKKAQQTMKEVKELVGLWSFSKSNKQKQSENILKVNTKYTLQFKYDLINEYERNSFDVARIAKQFGIAKSTINNWIVKKEGILFDGRRNGLSAQRINIQGSHPYENSFI